MGIIENKLRERHEDQSDMQDVVELLVEVLGDRYRRAGLARFEGTVAILPVTFAEDVPPEVGAALVTVSRERVDRETVFVVAVDGRVVVPKMRRSDRFEREVLTILFHRELHEALDQRLTDYVWRLEE